MPGSGGSFEHLDHLFLRGCVNPFAVWIGEEFYGLGDFLGPFVGHRGLAAHLGGNEQLQTVDFERTVEPCRDARIRGDCSALVVGGGVGSGSALFE